MAEEAAATTAATSNCDVDLGNLMAYDPSHHVVAAASNRFHLFARTSSCSM
jgi:regulator of ribosome biosynthesis